jgi:hypothetical protein
LSSIALYSPLLQYMEALVQCRKDNRFSRYLGACNEITYDLSACLVKEKTVARADRQAKWVCVKCSGVHPVFHMVTAAKM